VLLGIVLALATWAVVDWAVVDWEARLLSRALKGQRAMAVAKVYPEPEKGGRGKVSKMEAFKVNHISEARAVLRRAPGSPHKVYNQRQGRNSMTTIDDKTFFRENPLRCYRARLATSHEVFQMYGMLDAKAQQDLARRDRFVHVIVH
jgi:hypothetical protein